MSVVQTVLVYVVIPLAVVSIVGALTLGPAVRGHARYRPGRPWTYQPAWWLPQPDGDHPLPDTVRAEQIAPHTYQGATPTPTVSVGGASGKW